MYDQVVGQNYRFRIRAGIHHLWNQGSSPLLFARHGFDKTDYAPSSRLQVFFNVLLLMHMTTARLRQPLTFENRNTRLDLFLIIILPGSIEPDFDRISGRPRSISAS